jgi:ribonuclease VapC
MEKRGFPMVIDTSALFAILTKEPDALLFSKAIEKDPVRLISAGTLLEIGILVESCYGMEGKRCLELLLYKIAAKVMPVIESHAQEGVRAYRLYGKGKHPASLNYGDCFSYALAKLSGEPLLCKGTNFSQTDLPVVSMQ